MTVETEIRARLIADSAVAALVAGRIHAQLAPQGEAAPFVTFQRVSGVPTRSLDGPSGLVRTRVQLDAWDGRHIAARALAKAIKASLDGFRGDLGAVLGAAIALDSERDLYDGEAELHRVSMDFIIWHQEE